ncbi:hypothetical protein E4T56_gene1169 [Termitomyces sp. T112]|nr:hypothetical protein E4T56_gene1169 [Termitomyces sp. T112]
MIHTTLPNLPRHIESRIRHQTSPPLWLHPYNGSPHGHPPQLTPNLQPLTQTVKLPPTPPLPSPPNLFPRTKLTLTSSKEQHPKTWRPSDQMSNNVSGTTPTLRQTRTPTHCKTVTHCMRIASHDEFATQPHSQVKTQPQPPHQLQTPAIPTPSSARTSPKANITNKPPLSNPGVDSGTAQFFSDEGTPDLQEGTTLGTSPKASPLRRAIPQPTPTLPLPKRNIHQHNSDRPPNSREFINTPEHTKAPLETCPSTDTILRNTVTTRPLNPRTSSINPPNPQKTPDALPNFRPCPAPISANSNASPANSDGLLANFGAFPMPLTLTLDLPNPKNHPHCSRSLPPIINSTPWFLRPIPEYHDNLRATRVPQ